MKLPPLSNVGNFFPKLNPQSDEKSTDGRPFSVVQIEVTSRCGTGCVFCPHDALSDRWVEGDLPLDLYRECIAPHLDLFGLVYLQGWGEPMLRRNVTLWFEDGRLVRTEGAEDELLELTEEGIANIEIEDSELDDPNRGQEED